MAEGQPRLWRYFQHAFARHQCKTGSSRRAIISQWYNAVKQICDHCHITSYCLDKQHPIILMSWLHFPKADARIYELRPLRGLWMTCQKRTLAVIERSHTQSQGFLSESKFDVSCFLGLEIKVAFGNVWKQSLAELSGGQRSLLALSLILAMLLFKPAPIYILDEVCSHTARQ